ncbi:hypothetical protein NOS3756_47070 [Nostoc sp. NIES-3756]|uniref:PEP-CTERM sorting domain-containing protein n=1 Tax=Nostoc sp. NIES-3756 TaxID=1751286 RepID=UPI00072211E5|nr:PEP-CTERM sorting domain-containing protein [Nostoc sp. NIES-3756]BAT55714.1 hypothetical protein NOS3756_47070 [Nostoc sp. NIES-3756]
MRKQSGILFALSAIALTPIGIVLSQAPASAITLNLRNISFPDLGTVTGSFDYDSSSNSITNWSITTSASGVSPQPFPSGFTYTSATSSAFAPNISIPFTNISTNDRLFAFSANNTRRIFGIWLSSPVNNDIPASYAVSRVAEGNASNLNAFFGNLVAGRLSAGFRITTSGNLNVDPIIQEPNPVPEPEDILGIGVALGCLYLFGKTYYKKSKIKSVAKV